MEKATGIEQDANIWFNKGLDLIVKGNHTEAIQWTAPLIMDS